MALKLYYNLMSQPSRALYILLKATKCNFESNYVDLRKGEHFTEGFSKINRLQKIPVIDHNGLLLSESVAIVNYLSREGLIPETLYPRVSRTRALVQEYLEWQHVGLRLHCAMYFRVKYLDPILLGRTPSEEQIKGYEERMVSALELLETKWLGRGTDFIVGNNITVADLWAACELEQPRMAGFDAKDKFPNIATWWAKVRQNFNPHYDEAHIILNKIVQKQQKASKL
ncbi:Glutathione S-transferase theta-1 [Papilio machaon]|uniref:Glutathione S-transferase theta-1 n=1 Tax=Papilio machaon TaxID=76193 RepID=A0A0N1PJW2_PAPMA|nr:Glutathione S-transferase theta-1 [Papilio machaon]